MIWPLPCQSSFQNDQIFWKMLIIELSYLIKFAKILLSVAFVWKRFDHNIILGIVKIVIIYCIWSAPKSGQKRPQEKIKKKVGDVLIAKILKNPFPTGKSHPKNHIFILITSDITAFVDEKRTQNRNTAQHHTLVANHAHEVDLGATIPVIYYVIQVHVHRVRLRKK